MIRHRSAHILISAIAIICALAASGCAVPFGPGYIVEKQRIEVTYSLDAPDRVTVLGWYQVKNSGTQPLEEMSLQLPSETEFAPQNVHAEWGGKLLGSPPATDDKGIAHVPLGTRWNRGDRGEFAVSYDLETAVVNLATSAKGGGAIFLSTSGWYPVLMPPHGTFASGGKPPLKWDLIVNVPQGYHVHTSGLERGPDRSRGKTGPGASLRFEQIPLSDFEPFVAAGPFVEQVLKTANGEVILWTSHPVRAERAREIGERVATDEAFFNSEFGADPKEKQSTWIIECSTGSPGSTQTPTLSPKGCLTGPHSVVFPPEFFSNGASQDLLESVDPQLAATLFHLSVHILAEDPQFPISTAGDYAVFALITSRNPAARTAVVRDILHRYDANAPAAEKPLLRVSKDDPKQLQEHARVQSQLFFIALEDRCGGANLHHAIARALRILHGQTWDIDDLRSAAEAECGASLADFFRLWLNRPGIPEDFRARYTEAFNAAPKQPGQK